MSLHVADSAVSRGHWQGLVVFVLLVAGLSAFAGGSPTAAGARSPEPAEVDERPRVGTNLALSDAQSGSLVPSARGGSSSQAAQSESTPVAYSQWTEHDSQGDRYVLLADQPNTCIFGDTQHGADISIPLYIDDFGPVDSDGYPASGNQLFGKRGRLTVVAYDVDDQASSPSPPEYDWLFLGSSDPINRSTKNSSVS